jgi:HK97 family phage portal protein
MDVYVRDENAEPQELLRLDPDAVTPQVAGKDMVYKIKFQTGPNATEDKYLVASDVLHFKGLGNGLVGQSIVDNMLDALGLAGALQRFASVYFANNCAPGMLLEYSQMPVKGEEKKDEMKKNLERLHMGLDKAHRVGVIPWGFKLVNYTIDAEKAQLLQSRQFTLIDVANAIGISAQKLGAQISTNYNSLESERKAFLEDLEIYLVSMEEELNYKLLTESEKRLGRIYFQFDRSAMEKPDAKTEEDIWTDRLNNGKVTFNEYRIGTNQSTSDEEWADMHRMPAQIIYAEQAAEPDPDPIPPVIPPQPPEALPSDDQAPAVPAPDPAAERYRKLVGLDVDRLIVRLRKAMEGKPDDWYTSQEIIGHRDVFVRSIPWGGSAIDDFLEDVIERKAIDEDRVSKLKEALWTS